MFTRRQKRQIWTKSKQFLIYISHPTSTTFPTKSYKFDEQKHSTQMINFQTLISHSYIHHFPDYHHWNKIIHCLNDARTDSYIAKICWRWNYNFIFSPILFLFLLFKDIVVNNGEIMHECRLEQGKWKVLQPQ